MDKTKSIIREDKHMENQTDKQLTKEELKEQEVATQLAMAERIEKATELMKIENDRLTELQGRAELGGKSEAGAEMPKPEPMTDIEFANQVKLGLINPLSADGYL